MVHIFLCFHQPLLPGCDPPSNQAAILAVLAVIGGVDSRPRLGGLVNHEEFGVGTVSKITPNGKVLVQFSDEGPKPCRLTELTTVCMNIIKGVNIFKKNLIDVHKIAGEKPSLPMTTLHFEPVRDNCDI